MEVGSCETVERSLNWHRILMRMDSTQTPYRLPQQQRSQKSLGRLLDAAEEQIRTDGLESFTIADVVGRAGLSVGAFYSRFPDKTALVHAVQERFHDRLEPLIHADLAKAAQSGDCLEDTVSCAVDVFVKHILDEKELSRAFMMHSVFDPVLRVRGEEVNRARRDALISLLMPYRDDISHNDPLLAIDIAYAMYAAILRGVLIFGSEHELYYDLPFQTLFSELKTALSRYLRGEGSPA